VDVGQTVAASLQSPTLFEIAADLTKMQVKASIDEADMGRVRAGQTATFTVDAYPTDVFRGIVAQVRLQPTVTQNVTTYSSIVSVANPDLKLKPGMTASIRIQVASRSGALRVANGALRFRPTAEIFAALRQPALRQAAPGARVWTYADGRLTPVPVRIGISDGTNTELVETSFEVGARLVTAVNVDGSSTGSTRRTTTSPLTPGRPMGGGPPGPPM
jgi:HlyD family secretion protein